jgi:PKD repeat protein
LYFDASDSYDTISDLNSLQYRWDFDDYNTTPWLNESTTNHYYTMEGNYTVRVFVRDDDSEIDSDIAKVSVVNVQPFAKIGDFNQDIAIGEPVTFNASGSYDSESDNDTLRYDWTFGDSKGAEGMTVTHSYADEGEYIITLTVTDDDGAQSSAQSKIRIMNAVPYCSAMADQMLKEDELIILTGTGSDTKADENDLLYSWDLGIPEIPSTPWSNTPGFEYKYSNDGEYIAILTVKDDDSATASAEVNIYVENVEPNAKFSVSSGKVNEDEPIIFDASTSTDTPSDVESLNYSWNFKDGTPTRYGKLVVHEFVDAGGYQVELTITDDNDASDSYTKRVNVENVKPKADILASSKSITTSHVVSFSAEYSWDTPSDRDELTFDWDFGDDSEATGVTASHNYTSPGSYTVSLTVTDDDGSQATAEFELRVNEFIGAEPEQTDDSEQQDENSEYIGYAGGLVGALVMIFIILLLLYLFKSGNRRDDDN